ncbi:hypothetical protein D9613_003265 [Agrocybe pediades]|uniref:Uncharacterized protein n=1 Tax=Agrocybe pediades TaxID=84607 RepID=A0A8H4QQH8_9AGAR|nr:hypothetical protein D9613_003265 [Agrocybe pediades]
MLSGIGKGATRSAFSKLGSSSKPFVNSTRHRFFSSTSSYSTKSWQSRNGAVVALVSTVVAGSALWYTAGTIRADAAPTARSISNPTTEKPSTTVISAENIKKLDDPDTLYSLVWGSNANKTLSPYVSGDEAIRSPAVAHCLDGVALRDLQLHEKHAACIDGRGDIYQWGDGFFGHTLAGSSLPKLTLRGKNIVKLELTADKVFALSASGKVYVLAANVVEQEHAAGRPTPSSDSWWGTGWLWGEDETIDFAELTAAENLAWRESFTSISAGNHHLLALTSKGRVFAHPIDKKANNYGQLGFSKFALPDPMAAVTKRESHLHVELVPKSLADPYQKTSSAMRMNVSVTTSAQDHLKAADKDNLAAINDQTIRFCPFLYEVPILKGIDVVEIAAGGRSSFARTKSGRVLGWGANEFGQLGLGANVALDTIIIPTEVVLWRFAPANARTKCVDITARGDLTAFTVMRESEAGKVTSTDVLMAGNGQYGGLGNNLYTTAQSVPLRVKGVSGLVQYSDKLKRLEPITPEEIEISPTGHVLLALNSSAESGGVGGRDLMVWGRNQDSELGNGKKGSLAVPTVLQTSSDDDAERFMLKTRTAKEVKDMHGRVWKKNVKVAQRAAVGWKNSVVYWKIVE